MGRGDSGWRGRIQDGGGGYRGWGGIEGGEG